MGETPEAIRDDIARQRQAMTQDINELEGRAKSLTDWKRQYQERPMIVLGIVAVFALLIGLLVARLVRGITD